MFTNRNYTFDNDFPQEFSHLRNKKIDDWEIAPWDILIDTEQLLGKGEFGYVYLAKWKSTQVVAKVIKGNITNDQKELFLNEFNILSKSHHPNIVQIFGYVENPFIIVMEYLSDQDLLYHIRKNRLSLVNKINICLDILKGVEYLHTHKPQSIIHRDLKPQNIILDASKTAKISDFGLSRFLENNHSSKKFPEENLSELTKTSNEDGLTTMVGTKRYMSPEVTQQPRYNQKIDIWSLGVIFSELFENRRYNTDFYWRKTPVRIQKIIQEYMLKENPDNRLNAQEIIVFFEDIKSRYTKKKYYPFSCLFKK